ncbi:pyridoxamine 5'-phosphate oxidase family protein [Flavicella sp.]|uniref:pyridoxamine 5'-phosphate oxidase family protein n=1 Tax=Flavicella sp. TaxID=2957742 RepID=UPI0026142423|nr:pyridoxamine 5'-phosphate oxidase family protein [Flavicella sp.]MDG1805323.1 pyridoxamine 5'-phosphate oxidase family protein [Flavicella sp.]
MHTGTEGEKEIQRQQGTSKRASKFYNSQMKNELSAKMKALIERQEMFFIATADAQGNCDCSPRFGQQGFIKILDNTTLAYPEYLGNGVFASLGNILENPHIGIVFVDFFDSTVGLHVNGSANSYKDFEIPKMYQEQISGFSKEIQVPIEQWVLVSIDEAYIHCSKHVPKLEKKDKTIHWGTDSKKEKAVDFFETAE